MCPHRERLTEYKQKPGSAGLLRGGPGVRAAQTPGKNQTLSWLMRWDMASPSGSTSLQTLHSPKI